MVRFLFSGTILVILALLGVMWAAFGVGGVVALAVIVMLIGSGAR